MQMVMKVLVGSTDYRGNILRMEQHSPDRLIIYAEANSGEPLLYALCEAFSYLKVEMKEK